MRRLAAASVLLVLLLAAAGCGGGGGGGTVARVGDDPITKEQLDRVVKHFRAEAEREGRDFPQEGTSGFERLRSQLLGLLVYRVELQQAAKRLDVTVKESEIGRRLPTGEQEGDPQDDTFAHDAVEVQLLTERLFAKVTRGIAGAAERNRRWAAFLTRLRRETTVRYEPGYAPGS